MTSTATFSRHAVAVWTGDISGGEGNVAAGTEAFAVPMTFPRLSGDPPGMTTPEELLAASQANCYAIALRSVLAQRRGSAQRITIRATITAEKGGGLIRLTGSHLDGTIEGLEGVDSATLQDAARVAEERCTISSLIRAVAPVTSSVVAVSSATR
ncbi:MAG TPA: OsmC family peroxiredoxin [Gemmatimonadaceae bacterium]|nr:OsmC family peroxiredoxin [Gemmatimonadaceae bacterium]